MNGILYVPYINTELDENNFNYNGPELDYLGKLNEIENNIVGGDYYVNHKPNNSIGFNSQNNSNFNYSDQISFYELKCNIFNIDEKEETMDELINFYQAKQSFIIMFSFDYDNTDEECLIELKSWISESKKVMNMPENIYGEETKIGLLPRRQFKLKIGKANAFLEECILYDNYNNKIIIFVKEITFYK
jgi:hypothetical protein